MSSTCGLKGRMKYKLEKEKKGTKITSISLMSSFNCAIIFALHQIIIDPDVSSLPLSFSLSLLSIIHFLPFHLSVFSLFHCILNVYHVPEKDFWVLEMKS
jgi:hypothetical protein